MTQFDYDIGVIGGGAAGLTAASGAAQLGAKTLLVEKEKELGGDCLHFGCVPSKTLIKSANVYHQMKHAANYGLPGIEMAQAFNRLGSQVHVIEMFDQILPKEDKSMAEAVMQVLLDEGVNFHLNSKVIGVRELSGGDREVDIQAADGAMESMRGDTLLVSVGRVPNVRELGLDDIDVEVSRTGLVVDNRLRTRHKHIYGAGDVIGGYQFTHAAGYEGSIVVSNAIFHLPRKVDYTFLPWVTYTDPELASIGMNERRAQEAGIGYSVYTESFRDNDRSLAEGETFGRIKMILDRRDAPIGVQVLGPRASDLINEWVALLNGKVKLSTLASAIHPYPTLGEINKKVAGTYYAPKIFSDKVKKVLKLFFNFKGRACGDVNRE